MREELKQKIDALINDHAVVLFMKGSKDRPQCGFSKQVVEVLNSLTDDFITVDVLMDPELREAIKIYSSWPTIPQLYINREFIGGCDIVLDLAAKNELPKLLGLLKAETKPAITISKKAQEAFRQAAMDKEANESIRISISQGCEYGLSFSKKNNDDFVYAEDGFEIVIDPYSAAYAEGMKVDYKEDHLEAGFSFECGHDDEEVHELSATELKSWLDEGEDVLVIDVRPQFERDMAKLSCAKPLFAMSEQDIDELDKDHPIVFHCHHGGRSRRVAEEWQAKGFKNLYNLSGGIDAWSRLVDRNVPVYTK